MNVTLYVYVIETSCWSAPNDFRLFVSLADSFVTSVCSTLHITIHYHTHQQKSCWSGTCKKNKITDAWQKYYNNAKLTGNLGFNLTHQVTLGSVSESVDPVSHSGMKLDCQMWHQHSASNNVLAVTAVDQDRHNSWTVSSSVEA